MAFNNAMSNQSSHSFSTVHLTGGTVYEPVKKGSIFPREIISWLHLLQLSHPIKCPRRDLSNGFLIAEICSLYWKDVSMNSFRNRLSLDAKVENWELLQKAFSRNGVPLGGKIVEGMIQCQEGYAETFLRQLYTLLTGKEIIESLPLQKKVVKVDVYNPGALAQQMKSTMEAYRSLKESEDQSDGKVVTDRQHQATRGPADLHQLPDIDASRQAAERRATGVQPIKNNGATEKREASDPTVTQTELGDEVDGSPVVDGRTGFQLQVEVHAAEHTSSVVKEPTLFTTQQDVPGALREGRAKPPQNLVLDALPIRSAKEWIESIVKRFVDDGWRLTPDCPTYMQFLLQHEKDIEGKIQGKIWNALLSRIGELVEIVKNNSAALKEVVDLMLVSPDIMVVGLMASSEGPLGGGTSPSSAVSPSSAFSQSTNMGRVPSSEASPVSVPTRSRNRRENVPVVTSPRVFMLLAAMLSHLTDLDPFYSFSAFVRCIVTCPSIQLVWRRLTFPLAEMYASLVCSVVSNDPETAVQLLPDLLSSIYDSITGDNSGVEAQVSYLTMLRAIVARLVRPSRTTRTLIGSARRSSLRDAFSNGGGPGGTQHDSPTRQGDAAFSPSPRGSRKKNNMASGANLTGATTTKNSINSLPTPSSIRDGAATAFQAADVSLHLHALANTNAVTAMSSESTSVRLAGAALALTIVSTGYPLVDALHQFKTLLFPHGPRSIPGKMTPVEHVIRAMWLQCVQQRLCEEEDIYGLSSPGLEGGGVGAMKAPSGRVSQGDTASGGHSSKQVHRQLNASNTPASSGTPSPGESEQLNTNLLPMFLSLSSFLKQPGGHKRSKALIAYELVISLNFLPFQPASTAAAEGSPIVDIVAGAVMTFFTQQCSKDIIQILVAAPNEGAAPAPSGDESLANNNKEANRPKPLTSPSLASALMVHPVVGPLSADQMLSRTNTVLLCQALYNVALPSTLDMKDATRRLGLRAVALVRERSIPVDVHHRLEWLFWLTVSGIGFKPLPISNNFASGKEMRLRWRDVLFAAFDDIALITNASDVIQQQRTPADEALQMVVEVARKARRVVLRWQTCLSSFLTESENAVGNGTGAVFGKKHQLGALPLGEETTENLNRAMEWFLDHFHPSLKGSEDEN